MSASITWTRDLAMFPARVAALGARALGRIERLFAAEAAAAESAAKTGAPWTDQTGAARNALRGSSEASDARAELVLSHGVDYGIWLEVANQGRYATVIPTMQATVPRVQSGLRGLLA